MVLKAVEGRDKGVKEAEVEGEEETLAACCMGDGADSMGGMVG